MVLVALFKVLPFRLMYLFSDFLSFMMFNVFTYRKSMILKNLKETFPEKSDKEIKAICKDFYRNLCDILLEAIKGLTLKDHQIVERYEFAFDEKLNDYFNKGQSVIATTAHLTNWEWGALASGIVLKHKILGVYKKVSHPYINDLLIRSRSKFNVTLAEMKETADMMSSFDSDRPFMLMLIADQRPSDPYKGYWTNFLNRDTAFFYGPEKFAFEYKFPVLFLSIRRKKRGYYHVDVHWICDDPTKVEKGFIVEKYAKILEKEILERPADWLWSHSRWKHPKPADFIQN